MDYVVAGSDAYMTLPARKEGIIPGAANLRLPRFVGARIARQAILMGRRLDCDSPEGRMICDEVVPPGEVDAAVARAVEDFTGSGTVSAAGNRRAFRVGEEPLDAFRRYMAVYAREQAYCHFSPALIANLEKHWNAAQRQDLATAIIDSAPAIRGSMLQRMIQYAVSSRISRGRGYWMPAFAGMTFSGAAARSVPPARRSCACGCAPCRPWRKSASPD